MSFVLAAMKPGTNCCQQLTSKLLTNRKKRRLLFQPSGFTSLQIGVGNPFSVRAEPPTWSHDMQCSTSHQQDVLRRDPASSNFNHRCDWLLGGEQTMGLPFHFLPLTQHFDGLQSRWISRKSPKYQGNVSSLSQCAFAKIKTYNYPKTTVISFAWISAQPFP